MDPLFGVAQRTTAATGAYRQDLGEDRERGLLLGLGPDVKPAGTVDAVELLLVGAGLQQPRTPLLLIAP